MENARPLPHQRSLFPPADPASEVIASLRTWPDVDLYRLLRAGACELIGRGLPLPAAVPVLQAGYVALHQVAAIDVSAIAEVS